MQAQFEEEQNDADMFNNINDALEEAADKHIPKEKKKHCVRWENNTIIAKQQAIKEAQKVMADKKTESSIIYLNKAKEVLDNAYKQELNTYGKHYNQHSRKPIVTTCVGECE